MLREERGTLERNLEGDIVKSNKLYLYTFLCLPLIKGVLVPNLDLEM